MILWGESFEHYGTPAQMIEGLWAQLAPLGAAGISFDGNAATGDKCLKMGPLNQARRYLTDDFSKVGVALNFKLANLPTSASHRFGLITLRGPGGDELLSLRVISTGRVQLIEGDLDSGAVVVATSKLAAAAGTWNHLEVVAESGNVEVRLNGKQIILNTMPIVGPISEVSIGLNNSGTSNLFSTSTWIDNVIAQGGDDTDFVGLAGVYYLKPVADAVPQDWSLTAGASAYQLVDELVPDEDVSYIFTGTIDEVSTLVVEPLPLNVVEVLAVMPIMRVRKTDTGDCDVALGVRSGGIVATADDVAATLGYTYQFAVFETDPEDDAGWEPSPMPEIQITRAL